MKKKQKTKQIRDFTSSFTDCTYSYLRKMYRLEKEDGTYVLSTFRALPRWAKILWRLNRLDLARDKRDDGKLSDIDRLPDHLKPKSRGHPTNRLPARIKWLQSLDSTGNPSLFERAVSAILTQ